MTLHKHLYILLLSFVCISVPSEAQPLRKNSDARRMGTLTPFKVELVVALYYADDNLEEQFVEATRKSLVGNNSSSSLVAVQHFCKCVNHQATSHQVNVVALPMGVTVNTKISSTFSTDTECSVTQVRRSLPSDEADDSIAPGSVILQVTVEQIVYITSTWDMSQEEVSDLLKHGFMRTSGGRTRFRSLLLQNPAFGDIVKVDLLNDESAWADPAEPLSAPLLMPSLHPSLAPSLNGLRPSTRPVISSFSPSFVMPTAFDFPTFESTETIKDHRDKKGLPRGFRGFLVFLGVMAIVLVACLLLLCGHFICFSYNLHPRAHDNNEETLQDRICVHDGTSGQTETDDVLRITNVVEESLVENDWDPDVRVPCDPYETSLWSPSKVTKELVVVAPNNYQSALDIGSRKLKDDDSDEDEEDLFFSITKMHPRTSTSRQKTPKSVLGCDLLRDYRAQERASKMRDDDADRFSRVDARDAVATLTAEPTSLVDTVKYPEFSGLELQQDDEGHEGSLILDGEDKLAVSKNTSGHEACIVPLGRPSPIEVTSAVSAEHPLLVGTSKQPPNLGAVLDLREEEVNDVFEFSSSISSLNDSNSGEIETIMMGELSNLPNSSSFDLRDDLEPLESRDETAELTSRHIWTNTADEAARITPLHRQRKSSFDGPLWSVLWEARQLFEAELTAVESLDSTVHQESQSVLKKEVLHTEQRSADSALKGTLHEAVSPVESNSDGEDVSSPNVCSASPHTEGKQCSATCLEQKIETPEVSLDQLGTLTNNMDLLDDIESTDSIIFEDRDRANDLYACDALSLQSSDSYRPDRRPDTWSKLHPRSLDHGIVPRWLDGDLKRFDLSDACCDSTDTTSTSYASASTRSSRQGNRQHRVITVPPGKLGVVLANRSNGPGTFVSKVRPTSCLRGLVSSGDKLAALDGEDVTLMTVSEVTSLITSRIDHERTLTVLRKKDRVEKRVV